MAFQVDRRKLEKMSPDEMNNLEAGIYPDYVVENLFQSADEEEISIQETHALLKLIMRSPELDQSIEYEEAIYELYDYEVEQNQGKDLLYWTLVGTAFFSKNDFDSLMYQDYVDYGRGLLYEGNFAAFITVLKKLVEKEPISKFQFVELVKDFARLNQIPVAKRLDDLGKKIFVSQWDSDFLEKTISEQHPQQGDFHQYHLKIDDGIFDVLKEENIDFEQDNKDFDGLISIEELSNLIKSDPPLEKYLPFVPDMVNYLFSYWDEDREISYTILNMLRNLSNSIMPELVILGDLLSFDQEDVFVSKTFGKYQGFSLSHIEEFINNPRLCSEIRGNAGLMLMDIAQRYPEQRSNIIDILSTIIGDPPQDTLESEALVTSLVADVLDYDLFELKKAILKAFNENRIDPTVVQSRDFTGIWNLEGVKLDQISSGKPIFLECKVCGRTRRYGFDYLFLDIEQTLKGFDWDSLHFFIDHPVICSKCGAVDNYRVASKSIIGLMPGLFLNDEDTPFTELIDERIFMIIFDFVVDLGLEDISFSSVRQHVLSGKSQKLNPLILGEYYRVIGHFKEALEIFRKAHKMAPEDRKGLLMRAAAEHDFGDKEKAKNLYQRVLSLTNGDIYLSISDYINRIALAGLASLNEGQLSLFPYPNNINGVSLLDYLQEHKKGKKRRR